MRNEDNNMEPGLLPFFRLYTAFLIIAFMAISFFRYIVFNEMFVRDMIFKIFLTNCFLLVYLYIPWLRKKLKHFYLPIAIIVSILTPTISNTVDIITRLQTQQTVYTDFTWTLVILLLPPLVIAAWQYEYHIVFLLFTVFGLFDSVVLAIFHGITEDILDIILISLTRIIALSATGYMITALLRIQKEQKSELVEANRKLREHSRTVQELSASRERILMSRELHDTLAHTLSSLAVQLEALNTIIPAKTDAEIRERVRGALQTTRSGLSDTRRALQSLRAAPLEDVGLNLAVIEMINRFRDGTGIKITHECIEKLESIPPAAEQPVYRIIQEGLENIRRHAEADSVSVSIREQTDSTTGHDLTLVICDNGKGFDPSSVSMKDHFGLRGMEEWAANIGAVLSIESAEGMGTTLVIQGIPFHD